MDSHATGNDTKTETELEGIQGNEGDVGVSHNSQGAASGEGSVAIENSGVGSVDYRNGTLDRKLFDDYFTIMLKFFGFF